MTKKLSAYLSKCYERGFIATLEAKSGKGVRAFSRNEGGYMAGNAIGILVLLVTLMLCALLFGTLQGQTEPKITALGDPKPTPALTTSKPPVGVPLTFSAWYLT